MNDIKSPSKILVGASANTKPAQLHPEIDIPFDTTTAYPAACEEDLYDPLATLNGFSSSRDSEPLECFADNFLQHGELRFLQKTIVGENGTPCAARLTSLISLWKLASDSHGVIIESGCVEKIAHWLRTSAAMDDTTPVEGTSSLLELALDLITLCARDPRVKGVIEEETMADISTIVARYINANGTVVEAGIRALVALAPVHPFAACMTLDLEFLAEQLAIPDIPAGVNATVVAGSFDIIAEISKVRTEMITFEWIEVLVMATKNICMVKEGSVPITYERSIWNCVMSLADNSENFSEYFTYDDTVVEALFRCLPRVGDELVPLRQEVAVRVCGPLVLRKIVVGLCTAEKPNGAAAADQKEGPEETEGFQMACEPPSPEAAAVFLGAIAPRLPALVLVDVREPLVEAITTLIKAEHEQHSLTVYTNLLNALNYALQARCGPSDPPLNSGDGADRCAFFHTLRTLLSGIAECGEEEAVAVRHAAYRVCESLFLYLQLTADDLMTSTETVNFIQECVLSDAGNAACSSFLLLTLNYASLRQFLIGRCRDVYARALEALEAAYDAGTVPLFLTLYKGELQ